LDNQTLVKQGLVVLKCFKYYKITFFSLLLLLLLCVCGCGPVNKARVYPANVTFDNKIYIIGGSTIKGEILDIVQEYDPVQNKWSNKAPIPTKRAAATAVALDDYIYVVGGLNNEDEVLASMERYDPVNDIWTVLKPMPNSRWNLMASAVNGKIYVFGGIIDIGSDRKHLNIIDVYDPKQDKWINSSSVKGSSAITPPEKRITPMPRNRSGAVSIASGDWVYLFGGRTGRSDISDSQVVSIIEAYNTKTDEWHSKGYLKKSLTSMGGCEMNNLVYLIGGAKDGVFQETVQVFDLESEEWLTEMDLKQSRGDPVCGIVNNSIYIIGGLTGTIDSPKVLNSVESVAIDH
jgi:N-acetylneuraminic acid mutarotase